MASLVKKLQSGAADATSPLARSAFGAKVDGRKHCRYPLFRPSGVPVLRANAMQVAQIMATDVATLSPDDTLDRALELFEGGELGHLVVLWRGGLFGLLSEREVARATGWKTAQERRNLGIDSPLLVRELVRERAVTLTPEHPVEAAASMMVGKRVGAIPILQGSLFVGLVTTRDLLAAFRKRNPAAEWGVAEDSKVSDYMRATVTARPEQPATEAASLCLQESQRFLPVTSQEKVVGIVSEHDLRRAFEGQEPEPVSGVMATNLVTISPEEGLAKAADSMLKHDVGALPVVRENSFVGLLTEDDIIQHCTSRPRAQG
ncbi:MAG TPA: CBS domain-containing protein [Planctomycetes bacterium]|nr:CBS domain-containing protein [Planctomycetota bacterium]HIL50789.1 CBS domain-containing protein [Planctomycetota bacterium]